MCLNINYLYEFSGEPWGVSSWCRPSYTRCRDSDEFSADSLRWGPLGCRCMRALTPAAAPSPRKPAGRGVTRRTPMLPPTTPGSAAGAGGGCRGARRPTPAGPWPFPCDPSARPAWARTGRRRGDGGGWVRRGGRWCCCPTTRRWTPSWSCSDWVCPRSGGRRGWGGWTRSAGPRIPLRRRCRPHRPPRLPQRRLDRENQGGRRCRPQLPRRSRRHACRGRRLWRRLPRSPPPGCRRNSPWCAWMTSVSARSSGISPSPNSSGEKNI